MTWICLPSLATQLSGLHPCDSPSVSLPPQKCPWTSHALAFYYPFCLYVLSYLLFVHWDSVQNCNPSAVLGAPSLCFLDQSTQYCNCVITRHQTLSLRTKSVFFWVPSTKFTV